MKYPKVLIIGQIPNEKNGSGITLSNLFRGWPKDRIACVSNIYLQDQLDFSVCEIYYQLGYSGKQHPFPLGILHPKIKCGIIQNKNTISNNKVIYKARKSFGLNKIHAFLDLSLTFLGLYNFVYKLQITKDFKDWITEYNPDVIYSQLSTLELIRFVNNVKVATNKPLVIHIMDDWPSKISQPGLFNSYWKNRINKEFRNLLDKSAALMSIGEAMSEEYKIRYGKNFIPFHNPIEINHWLPSSKNQWTIGEKFVILYAGRIGKGIKNSLSEMAVVVNNLYQSGVKVVFEIQSPDIKELENIISANECIKFLNPIKYSDLPKKFSSVDLLFLPEDFDQDSVEFLKFSIQTKVAEYMISGTPIVVFADGRTALAKYALKDNWAYVVTENRRSTLTKALNELTASHQLRIQLGTKAKETAIKNEDAEIVRLNFRKVLVEL